MWSGRLGASFRVYSRLSKILCLFTLPCIVQINRSLKRYFVQIESTFFCLRSLNAVATCAKNLIIFFIPFFEIAHWKNRIAISIKFTKSISCSDIQCFFCCCCCGHLLCNIHISHLSMNQYTYRCFFPQPFCCFISASSLPSNWNGLISIIFS